VELTEVCHEFLEGYKDTGLQRAISAAAFLATHLPIEIEFRNAKRICHMKCHFQYESHKPVLTSQNKLEAEYFQMFFCTALMSKQDSRNCINTQELEVSCTRLANYCKKGGLYNSSDLKFASTVGEDADFKEAYVTHWHSKLYEET
jgi:hypothetical protein